MDLQGKVLAVTGGFGTLGAAVVGAAQAAGAKVAAIDRAPRPAPAGALAHAMLVDGIDLSSLPDAEATIARVVDQLGRLDALVNVAGTFRWEMMEGTPLDTWDLLYTVNLKTAVAASKAALPHLVKSGDGRIVNVGSATSGKGAAGMISTLTGAFSIAADLPPP